jgi:hypothetical protein
MLHRTALHPGSFPMKRTILSAAVASLLVLSACAANEEEEAKESISAYLMEQQNESQMISLNEEEADCISEDMVDGIGVDQLKEYGLLKEDGTVAKNAEAGPMKEEDAEVMVDAMFECTDVMATIKEELAASMGQQSDEVKQCFDDALTEEAVRGMLVATFTGDQERANQELVGPLMACAQGGVEQPEQ